MGSFANFLFPPWTLEIVIEISQVSHGTNSVNTSFLSFYIQLMQFKSISVSIQHLVSHVIQVL